MALKRAAVQFSAGGWLPHVDVFETASAVVALVELAGVREDEVEVIVQDRALIVRGRRPGPSGHEPHAYHVLEISHGYFQRTIPLPLLVDSAGTRAAMHNGLLEIQMPKLPQQHLSVHIHVGA